MSELELLSLARSSRQTISSDFAQVITITFAMVIAIYYFLHQAGVRLKIFAFATYTFGMFAYLGMMLMESSVALGAMKELRALPSASQSSPTQFFLGLSESWVGTLSTVLLNMVYWVLWLGVGYLVFFWQKPPEIVSPDR